MKKHEKSVKNACFYPENAQNVAKMTAKIEKKRQKNT